MKASAEFLVDTQVEFPAEMPEERRTALLQAEYVQARELVRSGVIRSIWRIPGGLHNVGIWVVEDATDLHETMAALPLFPWVKVTVTPLARHPIEQDLD